MFVGLLTVPFGNDHTIDDIVGFASKAGITGLEIASGPGSHIDTTTFDKREADRVRALVKKAKLKITSLAYYANMTDGKPETADGILKVIDAAKLLGVDVVCTIAGLPQPGKSKEQMIREEMPKVFRPALDHAGELGIRLALENWYATNIEHFGLWDLVFDTLPDAHFGLNYDPSHLLWQGIDYLGGVDKYRDRIFHTHAKDVDMKDHIRREVGWNGPGWWRYVIPGFGQIDWGTFIERLYSIGYTGVLSIEHEDGAQGREEGFIRGLRYLKQFVD